MAESAPLRFTYILLLGIVRVYNMAIPICLVVNFPSLRAAMMWSLGGRGRDSLLPKVRLRSHVLGGCGGGAPGKATRLYLYIQCNFSIVFVYLLG